MDELLGDVSLDLSSLKHALIVVSNVAAGAQCVKDAVIDSGIVRHVIKLLVCIKNSLFKSSIHYVFIYRNTKMTV